MKYKNIPAMAHNHAHSFLSILNIVEGEFAITEIMKAARRLEKGEVLSLSIVPPAVPEKPVLEPLILKSLRRYAEKLPAHCASHNVDPASITQFLLHISKEKGERLRFVVEVTDDRGKTHTQDVIPP